jgi:hypothetical protein
MTNRPGGDACSEHCDPGAGSNPTPFKYMFLLDFESPPVRIREEGARGERWSAQFDVLEDVTFVPLPCPRGYTVLATDADPRRLSDYLAELPRATLAANQPPEEEGPDDGGLEPPPEAPGSDLPGWRRRVQERARARFAPFAKRQGPANRRVSAPRPLPGGEPSDEGSASSEPDGGDEDLPKPAPPRPDRFALTADVWEDLERKRAAWESQGDEEVFGHFRYRLTGGEYAQKQRGESHHTMLGTYRGQEAQEFIQKIHGLKFSGVFTISTYGFRNAVILVREWCHKMEHLLQLYEEHGADGFHARAANFLSSGEDYEEMEEFAELAASQCSQDTRDAITRVRKIANREYTPASSSSSAPAAIPSMAPLQMLRTSLVS